MNDLSFCKFNFQPSQRKVIWEVTNQCNYSCEYCIFSSTGRKPRGELSFEQICSVLSELKQLGFNYIKFTGGEPFMREDFINILKTAKNLDFKFDISTNASFITEQISQELCLLNLNFIHVSLDGYDIKSHDGIRGKKSFDKTLHGLKILLKHNKNIRIGSVIHAGNENYLQNMVDLVNELKAKEIIFSIMVPAGRMDKNSPRVCTKTPEELISNIDNLQTSYTKVNHNLHANIHPVTFGKSSKSCPGGTDFLFIDSIGIVSPCTWVSENHPQFHTLSLHNHSLQNILNTSMYRQFTDITKKLQGLCVADYYQDNHYFNKIYSFATENVSYLYQLPDTQNQHALTVTGSGDQAIMLAQRNFKNITCIDSNYLAKYYAELKITMMKHFTFKDFLSFFKNQEKTFNYQTYKKISRVLSPETEKFWNQQYIKFDYNGIKIRNSNLFNLKHDDWENKENNVPYLVSEDLYCELQKKLQDVLFNFIIEDFLDYKTDIKFDIILLSNIADYSHKIFKDDYMKHFKTEFVEKSLGLLSKKGTVMFAYIYDYENLGTSSIRNKINVSFIRKMYFKEFNYEEKIISSAIQNFSHDVICYIQNSY